MKLAWIRIGLDFFGQVIGAGDRSRTYDLRITNALLYQLSYTGGDKKGRLL